MSIIENSEEEMDFNLWLESIEFVGKEGNVLFTKLADDESDDPEGDRD